MNPLSRQIVAIVRPGVVWAVHFIAIYALVSATCAARALIAPPTLLWAGVLVTIPGVALCLWSVIAPPKHESDDLHRAVFWSGLIFALATFANASALLFFQSCGG